MKWKNVIFCKEKAAIKEIYCEAFTKSERMPWGFMLVLSCIPTTRFRAFYEDEKLCGFLYYGVLGRYLFVMFFSVKVELRCCGYGSRILTELRKQYPNHRIIVTIEPPLRDVLDIRARRKQFYLRNGFGETGFCIKSFGNVQEILISGGQFSRVGFSVLLLLYSCFAIWPIIKRNDSSSVIQK